MMQLTFVGCGDAFGKGGRFNTCFHVRTSKSCFLFDCIASSIIPAKLQGFDLNEIETIIPFTFHLLPVASLMMTGT